MDSTFTQSQVLNILSDLTALIKSTIRRESENLMHTNIEMLRQVFEEADLCGLTLKLDVSSIESEEAIQAIATLEDKLYPKNSKLTKLTPMAKGDLISTEEALKFKSENEQLREKLTAAQKQYTAMMADKTSIASKLRKLEEEYRELKEKNSNLELKYQQLIENSSEQENQHKEWSNYLESERNTSEEKIKYLSNEVERLNDELNSKKEELKRLEKELNNKITETTQFKNMKKILISKNDTIKDLRKKVAQYEPTSS